MVSTKCFVIIIGIHVVGLLPETQLINLSSCGGYTIVPTAVTYCATKFYVSTFTEGVAWELIESGAKMRAKVLAPAATQTEFGKKANNVDTYDYDKAFVVSDNTTSLYKS